MPALSINYNSYAKQIKFMVCIPFIDPPAALIPKHSLYMNIVKLTDRLTKILTHVIGSLVAG